MRLLDWLLRAAPAATDPAPAIPAAAPVLPPEDSADILAPEMVTEPDGTILLDDLFVAIEYTDAKGETSRRRITMRRILPGGEAPSVMAICHERGAPRRFRTDRIGCFITRDGEIVEPDTYWRGIGIDIGRIPVEKGAAGGRALMNRFRPAISVLVTLSRADSTMHPAEIDAILAYVADEASEVGVPCTADAIEFLRTRIIQMRPQQSSIESYYFATLTYRDSRQRRFARAVKEVILADGGIAIQESDFASRLEEWALAESERVERELEETGFVVRIEIDDALTARLARIERSGR